MNNVIAISDSFNCPHSIESYFHLLNTYEFVKALILREPHLSPFEYEAHLTKWLSFSNRKFEIIVHSHGHLALKYRLNHLHLPYLQFQDQHEKWTSSGLSLSTSVHSLEEALCAEDKGAAFLIGGPIFKTSCKPNATPKGSLFIKDLSSAVKCPIYAIGGLSFGDKLKEVFLNGASGVCMRSELWGYFEHIKRG